MTPIYLRHPRATTQSLLMGVLALITTALSVFGIVAYPGGLKWLSVLIAIPALFFAYMCVRTATLRVRLDDQGVWEPNPFRLSYVTPWQDISQVRKRLTKGRFDFVGVELVFTDGTDREIVALKMQAKAAGTEEAVDSWVEIMRAAKADALR